MSIVGKLRRALSYNEIRPVIYSEELLKAYFGTSVVGGTLKQKTAVITGGTSGIGFSTAQRFLNEGCNVIITGRNKEKLEESVLKLERKPDLALSYVVIDQLDPNSIKKGIQDVFTTAIIDLWINCAGIFKKTDRDRVFRGLNAETYYEVVNTNLKSTVLMTRMVADEMMRKKIEGQIINVSSICGFTNHFGYTPYGISKTGVIEYTRLLAEQYEGRVLIEAIAPGSVATRMGTTGFGKNVAGTNSVTKHIALPEEIASVIAFLASPTGQYLNGQTILASAMETV